jgi:prephenate dehydratase
MQIAIQGAIGSFHNEAALKIDPQAHIVPQQTFADVFRAVLAGEAEYGLCAIENNIHGPINEVYRLLERHDVWVMRDVRLHIAQQLIGYGPADLSELANDPDVRVLSQAPALAQVELWLDNNLPLANRIETHDTAASVQDVVVLRSSKTLAVASRLAAETYGGTIVAADIQDEPHNYTRFILFQKQRTESVDASHGSMILKTDHTPGALLRALQVFADESSNLTKLDSHPIPGDKRHYAFYIDYELPRPESSAVMTETLEAQGCHVKLLGEYSSIK